MMEYSLIKKLFRTIELGVDEYMSQLDLQSVSLDDSGMYVCFVTSLGAGGFSVKSSFIHVIESKIFFKYRIPVKDETAKTTVRNSFIVFTYIIGSLVYLISKPLINYKNARKQYVGFRYFIYLYFIILEFQVVVKLSSFVGNLVVSNITLYKL